MTHRNNHGFWTEMERIQREDHGDDKPFGLLRGLGYALLFMLMGAVVVVGFVF